jgi:hypothetical protein
MSGFHLKAIGGASLSCDVDMADGMSRGQSSSSSIFLIDLTPIESRQEVKRRRRVMFIFPAVGMLIFASCPEACAGDRFASF